MTIAFCRAVGLVSKAFRTATSSVDFSSNVGVQVLGSLEGHLVSVKPKPWVFGKLTWTLARSRSCVRWYHGNVRFRALHSVVNYEKKFFMTSCATIFSSLIAQQSGRLIATWAEIERRLVCQLTATSHSTSHSSQQSSKGFLQQKWQKISIGRTVAHLQVILPFLKRASPLSEKKST